MSWSGASGAMARQALVITGATATGKTAVSIRVARRIGGEIISMDSRQVYRGMDIGTAKPSLDERDGVPHHGFDVVEPGERFNAGRFADLARDWIAGIRGRGRVPILVGGTGFFLRSLTHPMFEEPPLDARRKEQWKRYLADLPGEMVARWAARLDPELARRTTDRQRLSRAIEIAVLTGRPLTWWQRQAQPARPAIDLAIFVLDLPRELLVRRIEDRVDAMVRDGLVEEVRSLVAHGHDEREPGLDATGYIELIPHLRGERDLHEALDMVKVATRRYARRQRTWLRHQLPAGAYWLDADRPADELADIIVREWTEVGG
jgi:tRNA dimethylallyltransferase